MKENKMGIMPMGKLIITMSLPIMISMLVQALYNRPAPVPELLKTPEANPLSAPMS